MSQTYTHQSTCTFFSLFCLQNLRPELWSEEKPFIGQTAACEIWTVRIVKNQNTDKCKKKKIIKYIQLKNVEAFEARLSDGGERKKKKYNSTNLYQWMIN